MSIDSSDTESGDRELSICNSGSSNTSDASAQVKTSLGVELDTDEHDINEFKAMFMSKGPTHKTRPIYSSTPLISSQQQHQ